MKDEDGNGDNRDGGGTAIAPAIELTNVSKSFGAVRANRDINLTVKRGTIHGIVGENGAGKSTLMNILYGVLTPDTGEIKINGIPVKLRSSAAAKAMGIGMVHQHFTLVPPFSVLENVMLGAEGGGLLKQGEASVRRTLERLSEGYGMTVDPDAIVETLSVGVRQRVEIIKAMKDGADILILDEPTGVLTPQEAASLFDILLVLRDRGVSILLITHKLEEILSVTDEVSVIRDGTVVGHRITSETSGPELAELMVGREVLLEVDRGNPEAGEVLLATSNLTVLGEGGRALLKNATFEIRAGEILGVAGVAGNGQTELLEVLAGMRRVDEGAIILLGQAIDREHQLDPSEIRALGVGHIPEDRHEHGLVLDFTAEENAILGFHGDGLENRSNSRRSPFMSYASIREHCVSLMRGFDVRPSNPSAKARSFSGGNQQKIVIGRELRAEPLVLLVGQPTRGVDIGAIEFIHKQLVALRDKGCAILLVSVELDEILGLSDRIMVLNSGEQVGIIERDDADERTLGLMMAGIAPEVAA